MSDRPEAWPVQAIRPPSRLAVLAVPAAFILIALVFLWPVVARRNYVAYPPRSAFTDLLITHLPNARYVRASLAQYDQLPLWNAQILAGQPFAADPLAGLWYPPNVLLLALPLPLGFNLLAAIHLAWAGYGAYCLMRALGLSPAAAFLGGAAFGGTPKLVAHFGAGHVSLVFAVAWTPWLLWAVRRAAGEGGLKRGALAGACLAAVFLADVRWAFYAGVLGAAYWLALALAARRPPGVPPRRILSAAAAVIVIFVLLSAVLALPLAEFIAHSNRQALTLGEAAAFSLPPLYLLGLLIPDLGGFHEWMTYLSIVPLLLALPGLARRQLFWGAAVFLAGGFALGANFVLFPLFFRLLPGLSLLRVPPRAWFIVALGVAILAAYGADALAQALRDQLERPADSRGLRLLRHAPPALARYLLPALAALTVADLWRVNGTLFEARPEPERVPAAAWLARQPGLFRVYSPSYSLPAGDGLQHVDGVDPLQLAASVRVIEAASGVRAAGYSVTVPSFEADEGEVGVATANAGAVPDAELLGLLNVRFVAAEFDLHAPGLALAQTFGRTRVYENLSFKPRAWLGTEAADVVAWSPNRVVVRAEGPGLLVLSEVLYPGWRARVDGEPAPIEAYEGLLRGVWLEAGEHEVVFAFRPWTVFAGGGLTLLGLALLAAIWRWAA